MAKILVADDNSNVQKTVALALAGLGVDVVSVSNGEAAVRKLSEFTPDLVLADIFMPVRNGYEVCEYVKKDSRFKHVPVVLLVGAFDPLDEREAQRVGADGILKKPFVPPDPLITMVKTLLDRTLGERLVSVPVSKPAATAVSKAEASTVADVPLPAPQPSEEFPNLAPAPPVSNSAFEEGGRPVAFGQLMDTPEQDAAVPATELIEPVDNEQVFTSPRDATLGDPIFWRNDAPEPEPELETEEDNSAGLDMHNWKPGEDSLSRREDAVLLQPIEPLELVRDDVDEPSPSVVESGSILLDAAAQAPLTVDSGKAEELAANPIEWMATVPPEHSEQILESTPGWDEEIPASPNAIDLDEAIAAAPAPSPAIVSVPDSEKAAIPVPALEVAPEPASEEIADKTPEPSKTQPSLPASVQSLEDTARSIPKQEWTDLAAMLQASATVPAPRPSAPLISTQPLAQVTPAQPVLPLSATQPIAPVSAIPPPAQIVAPENTPLATPIPAQHSSPDPALVEAVVQRVLEKMRPQVVDIITKEFLRPIVQALVHREIKKQ